MILADAGMSTSPMPVDAQEARAQRISVTDDALVVELADGRTITVPLAWCPRLRTERMRNDHAGGLLATAKEFTGRISTRISASTDFSAGDARARRRFRYSAG